MKTVQIDKFDGLRNDVSQERFSPNDLSKATNIELDETGKPYRRAGITSLGATATHSLWSDGEVCFCVKNDTLYRVLPDLSMVSLGVAIRGRVAYRRIINEVFFTDGFITDSVLLYGTQDVQNGGVTESFDRIDTYSESFGRYMALTGSGGNARLPLLSTDAIPLPAGQLLGYYNGRLYVADNNYLWYTQPYDYHTCSVHNFIGFTAPVRTFAAVSDGIYIGSDTETVFLSGNDPTKFEHVQVSNYGTVLGTEAEVPGYFFKMGDQPSPKIVSMWMSKKGMCVGLDGGTMINLTGERYVPPAGAVTGASLFKVRGESPHLVTTLFS